VSLLTTYTTHFLDRPHPPDRPNRDNSSHDSSRSGYVFTLQAPGQTDSTTFCLDGSPCSPSSSRTRNFIWFLGHLTFVPGHVPKIKFATPFAGESARYIKRCPPQWFKRSVPSSATAPPFLRPYVFVHQTNQVARFNPPLYDLFWFLVQLQSSCTSIRQDYLCSRRRTSFVLELRTPLVFLWSCWFLLVFLCSWFLSQSPMMQKSSLFCFVLAFLLVCFVLYTGMTPGLPFPMF